MEHEVAEVGTNEISHHGFYMDVERIPEVKQQLSAEAAEIHIKLQESFPDEVTPKYHKTTGKPCKPIIRTFNANSPTQVSYYFDKYLGYEFEKNDKTGNAITDKDAMKMCPFEEADLVLQYRDRSTMLGYLKDWSARVRYSNKIHHTLNGVGTQTGRGSHSDPNLGQVSKASYARTLFIPHPGEIMVGADLSGLELRMLAHYLAVFGNQKYIDVVLYGKVHWHNALLAGIATDEIYDEDNPEHKHQYNVAKTFIYAWLYGAGVAKIGRIVGGGNAEGKELRDRFLSSIDGLKALKDDVSNQAKKLKGVKLVDGRVVPVRSQHAALNTLLQGSGAMVCKQWLIDTYKEKKKRTPNVKILAWVHDEIQSSCKHEDVEEYSKILIETAQGCSNKLNLLVPVDAEAMTGNNWKETH